MQLLSTSIRGVYPLNQVQHGIEKSMLVTVSYSNRSLAYIQLEKYSQAEADATNAIHCDATFTKAWLRRGICRIQGKQYRKAYTDLLRVSLIAITLL